MKRSSSIVILASLLLAGCGHLGSNGAMIAAADKYEVANPLCFNDSWDPNDTNPPPPGYKALKQAGLGHYTLATWNSLGIFTPSAALKPFFTTNNGGEFCVAHVVADSVAASEPLGNEAVMFGMSKNALRVEFRTHIDYGPWNSNSQVQHAFSDLLASVSSFSPSLTLIMYNDPVKGWVVLGRS